MLAVILNQHLIKRRKQEEYKTAHSSPPDYETKNIVSSSDGVSCAEKDEEGTVNYVSSGAFNNGVMKCLKPKEGEVLDKGHCITVSPLDGSSFWQENDFLGRGGSGASIALLYNDNLNQLNALFICSVIKKSAGKYGYANLLNGNNLKNLEVILPAITKYIPDFNTLTREVSGSVK